MCQENDAPATLVPESTGGALFDCSEDILRALSAVARSPLMRYAIPVRETPVALVQVSERVLLAGGHGCHRLGIVGPRSLASPARSPGVALPSVHRNLGRLEVLGIVKHVLRRRT